MKLKISVSNLVVLSLTGFGQGANSDFFFSSSSKYDDCLATMTNKNENTMGYNSFCTHIEKATALP